MQLNARTWAGCMVLISGLLLPGCVVYDVPGGPVGYVPPPPVAHEHRPPEPVIVLMSANDRDLILDYFGTLHRRNDPVSRRIYERGIIELPPRQRRNIHTGRPLPGGVRRESLPMGLLRQLSRLPAGFMWVRVGTDVMIVDARTGRVSDVLEDGARIAVRRDGRWSEDEGRRWHDAERGDRGGWTEAEAERWHGDHDARDEHWDDRRDDRRGHRDDRLPDVYFGRGERQVIEDYFTGLSGNMGRAAWQLMQRQFVNPPDRLRDMIREGDSLPRGVRPVPLPGDLESRLGRLPRGVERMRIGTDVVLLHRPTGTVLDVFRDGAALERDRRGARQERRDDRRDVREDRRHDRQDAREERREDRQEIREEHREARQERRDDRQEAREEHREDRQEVREERRDDRQEAREEHREARQDRREDRREDRQEVREERRDDRQEAREEHREARQDRREDRREARRAPVAPRREAAAAAFSDRDRGAITSYYASHRGRIKPLPPGMRNRLAKGKPLPRGIRGQALPKDLEQQLAPLPSGHRRLVVGTDMVILDAAGKVADLLKDFLR